MLVVGIINPALPVDKGKEEETAPVSIAVARFWSSHDNIIIVQGGQPDENCKYVLVLHVPGYF